LLREARAERQLTRLRKQLAQLALLILDELGYVPTGKAGAELLFDVLSTAYERVSLIVTTNLPFEHWTEVLGSERLTGAAWIGSRIVAPSWRRRAKATASAMHAAGKITRPKRKTLGATRRP
jgi:DNA replication protein DnaC